MTNAIHRDRAWRTKLQRWAMSQRGLPFEWGKTDCASLALAALRTMFDHKVIAPPPWSTLREARRVHAVYGSFAAVLEGLGAKVTALGFMRAGDLVVCDEPNEGAGREAVLVCLDGNECLTSNRASGVVVTRLSRDLPGFTVYSLWELADG